MNRKEIEQEIKRYREMGFNVWQMSEIREGLKNNVDVDKYTNLKFDSSQMEQIRCRLVNKKQKEPELEI